MMIVHGRHARMLPAIADADATRLCGECSYLDEGDDVCRLFGEDLEPREDGRYRRCAGCVEGSAYGLVTFSADDYAASAQFTNTAIDVQITVGLHAPFPVIVTAADSVTEEMWTGLTHAPGTDDAALLATAVVTLLGTGVDPREGFMRLIAPNKQSQDESDGPLFERHERKEPTP